MAASATQSACASAAYARGVSRNMLRDIWSSTITAASAVCASARRSSFPRDTRSSCKPRNRSRMLASNVGSFSNHWSGPVCSNQNVKTSPTHPAFGSSAIAEFSEIYASGFEPQQSNAPRLDLLESALPAAICQGACMHHEPERPFAELARLRHGSTDESALRSGALRLPPQRRKPLLQHHRQAYRGSPKRQDLRKEWHRTILICPRQPQSLFWPLL